MSGKEIHEKVISLWDKYNNSAHTEEQLASFLSHTIVFDQLSRGNIHSVVFSYQSFKIFHISPTAASFYGASVEEIMEKGAALILGKMDDSLLQFSMKATGMQAERVYSSTRAELLKTSVTFVNLKLNISKEIKRRALIHAFPVVLSQEDKPLIGMYFINDMEPYISSDTWWYRSKVGDDIRTYQSEQAAFKDGEIISDREMEVLKHLAKGLSSKEISERMFLSVNTVDNHRRNMLQRTGANDTSSLIHICSMCGIL
jgi:DNA-binding CsgD family transcriptional regulator